MADKKAKKSVKKGTAKNVVKKKTPKKIIPSEIPSESAQIDHSTDRVIRSGPSQKNAACPECKAFPTITKIRRKDYELRRCRECGHRFEIKGGD